MFVVGTVRDLVAPWRSVFKIRYQVDADLTFVLASGGPNVMGGNYLTKLR